MSDGEQTFVIVGASLAGAKAAETLRAEGFGGRIVLIGEETELPYERPPLSKGYMLGKDPREKAFVHDEKWYAEQRITLVLGRRATYLDPATRVVTLDGVEPVHYDKLLLATGSRVRTLNVPGNDLEGVRYLRTIDESDALRAAISGGNSRVVVVGAGWIGLETTAAAREYGCDVTVVEMDTLPLRRVLGDEVATIFRDLHVAHGVDFRFSSGVREFGGSGGRLSSVVLSDGTELPADLAIVGVGISPAVELAESAGLAIDNGIATNESLRTSDPNVYACGDVASSVNPLLGKRIRVEHWANALNGGKSVALSMLDREMVYDRVPYFYSDQYDSAPGMGMEYSGYVEPGGYDQVVFRGDPTIRSDASAEFIVFWVQEGRVLAGMNFNVWDVNDDIQKLVRAGYSGKAVDLEKLADPKVPLGDLVG
jgi:3-phenylpropionate/trans-cinnamate dioxygenase ferredoxin reductase subunit